jgi:formylglycine-generating enzyme required for sulfatase activity
VIAVALHIVWGAGCVRLGFDVPGDDGSGDGPVLDGPPKPDAPKADRKSGDGGAVPGIWVAIAKGTFTMGSPTSEPCRGDDEQQHLVTLTHDYELQETEVTQDQFLALMGYNSAVKTCSPSATCPVEMVSWHEAAAYCNALSQKAGKSMCYTCSGSRESANCQEAAGYSGQQVYNCPGYRLPTEAEWEYAYRAGTTTAYYSGVNDAGICSTCWTTDTNADKIGWYCANAGSDTHPVKGKQPNGWGLYDMAGNVWEWCHDWYQSNIGSGPATDPWGSPSGSSRVLRGGSWSNNAYSMRAADRHPHTPTYRFNYLGFRCCRTK